jgi:serine/threonine-protein kinase RsbW
VGRTEVIRLEVPNNLTYRSAVLRTVAAACKIARDDASPSDDFSSHVVSAVSEAFNNIVMHGYRGGGNGNGQGNTIKLEIGIEADGLLVRIEDFGESFDPRSVADPDLEALPESGLGLYIIRSFVDEFSYAPGRPNRMTLRKGARPRTSEGTGTGSAPGND